jgi:hypothetical protein
MHENWEDNDSARLQNIVHFLKGINAALSSMDLVSWMRPDTREGLLDEVQAERGDRNSGFRYLCLASSTGCVPRNFL